MPAGACRARAAAWQAWTTPGASAGSAPCCSQCSATGHSVLTKRLWKNAKCPIASTPISRCA
ncbi:hypothetical protein WL76_11035 [Burkholderia ubonensis]|uniref:Uncharacterized protein n=1 Tax=Burkholderia ubonensis TaxID=101571 RepID=A0A108C4I5_9BURK|nr:hypothetical protein WL76_11035 [Burkholderia ubonensis]KWK67906.1 hypothetical protein WM16_25850 [Burkholderia ubonensis]